ncbi:YcaO-like family protein [Bacillus cereus]|nr:YcaO-like family protein [Bacillus cereus]
MQKNWEREYNINDALYKGTEVCKELDIKINYQNIGNYLQTEYAELFDFQGKKLTSGVGKGGGLTSKVGALFEALEHYLTEYKIKYSKQKLFSLEEIPNIKCCDNEKIIQLLYSDSDREKLIPCQKYISLQNTSNELWYPTFITNPFYADKPKYFDKEINYSKLKRYSSNSGTAIGCSLNEAIIHASNEVIERDALSLFLLKYYYYRNNDTLKIIKRDTLSIDVKDFLRNAERELGQKISLVNLTTELDIPVILAILEHNKFGIPIYGSGASLYRDYAAKRAISELIQSYHMIQTYPSAHKEITKNINLLKGFPNQYVCAEFNTNTLLNAFEIEQVDFQTISNYSLDNLDMYLDYLAQLLNKHNFDIYYSICQKFTNGVHLVNVIIPNTERFFNVLFGQIVFPSDRGKTINTINKKPVIDYSTRFNHELVILDEFISNEKIPHGHSTNVYVEPYFSRENLFILQTSNHIFCGRKYAKAIDYESNTVNISPEIYPNMILGHFQTFQVTDNKVYLYYTPCTLNEIENVFLTLQHDEEAEILFPFSPLNDDFQEHLITSEIWDSLDDAQLEILDTNEAHFRDITIQYLHTQETCNKVFYDPACSTGTFLAHLKANFPYGKYIGSDQSKRMTELANKKIDFVFQAEASSPSPSNIKVDYLFLRFLNMEVVTITQAYNLFEHLIQLLNGDGKIIIFGYTPVRINIRYVADKYGMKIQRYVSVYNGNVSQYYILQKQIF